MKPSPSYPGYFVSRDGIVTKHKKLVLRQFPDKYGTLKVNVNCPNYSGSAVVARMVGEVYCKDFDKKLRAAYKDGNKSNCHASNLEWLPVSAVSRSPYSRNPRP